MTTTLAPDTLTRRTCWAEWSHWSGRVQANGMDIECGPVAELELGERVATALLGAG